ncbi:MAG: branched-chain amino acid ABC transporter permease [Jatrophihabitantaceae bacterium]
MNAVLARPWVKRLIGCLFGGFALAVMIGDQEGSEADFGIAFSQATKTGRLLIFLAIGVVLFVLITFWPRVVPYLNRPGALPLGVGFIAVLAAMVLMHWYDPVGKFGPLSTEVGNSSGVPVFAGLFFSWVAWALMIACLVLGGAAVITRLPVVGYAQVVLGVAAAVICYAGHAQVVTFAGGIDHSLGVYVATIGYLVFALCGLAAARSATEVADPRGAMDAVMGWRPGLPVVAAGLLLGLTTFFSASWFSPLQLNHGFSDLSTDFSGTGAGALASAYLSWLGITLLLVAVVAGAVAAYLRLSWAGWLVAVLGLVGVVISFITVYKITTVGSEVASQYGRRWQNLGVGGWVACLAFSLIAIGGFLTAMGARVGAEQVEQVEDGGINKLPVHAFTSKAGKSSSLILVLPIAISLALFYPPTLTVTWQSTIVTQIGVYILLAVGLNVVVGWAGLLDLGYIAFYGIGSYTTAYLVGSLPIKPPSWLLMSPLWAIPFAILACLIAGVLLGAPTLRLRGDYLAIVTLGFGEIVQRLAVNNPGNLTGGPQGPNVPHPVFKLGPIHITWGLDALPYWYLLLLLVIVMVVLFYRLEGSRLGRAWAAIREDEVAAQATGINTSKAKLLAFAIGASTSGLAGVFFASQVGYFDPTEFSLQNSILIVAYVVFGGMGSLPGAIAGAAVLTWLPQFLKDQVPPADRQMWIGALVLAMMIFRPGGLIPAKRRQAELTGLDAPLSAETHAVPASEGL